MVNANICKYHVVWTTKYRGKILADDYIKQGMKRIFKMLAKWNNHHYFNYAACIGGETETTG